MLRDLRDLGSDHLRNLVSIIVSADKNGGIVTESKMIGEFVGIGAGSIRTFRIEHAVEGFVELLALGFKGLEEIPSLGVLFFVVSTQR